MKLQAASGIEPEAAIFLIFFIKFGLVAITSDQDIRHPGRRFSHDRSDVTWIFRCGGAASPAWREPPVRTNGATFV